MKFKVIKLAMNQGHGNARQVSVKHCENNLVALMDADDLSLSCRFEKQLFAFVHEQNIDIIGAQISEFMDEPSNIIGQRVVPESDSEIKLYMKNHCPMNQVSVMFRKDFIEKIGGYIDWYCEEDYYLWIRAALAGGIFMNLPEVLVNVRVGSAMSLRRGGWKYFLSEAKLQRYMLEKRIILVPRFIWNIAVRFIGELMLPNFVRNRFYRIIRKKYEKGEKMNETNSQNELIEQYPPFSVAMCVYGGDNPEWFDAAVSSVINQTVKPNEIVLVVDGPIPDTIQTVIDKYVGIANRGGVIFEIIVLPKNCGHGIARRKSVDCCTNDIVALMDSDDICIAERFEKELLYLGTSGADIVGGNIAEFTDSENNIISYRKVPISNIEIRKYIRNRCPFNQMTVMFHKEAYQRAGGYLDWYCNEDYYLWLRMMQCNVIFANTGSVLVKVRVGSDMYKRRGGWDYFKSEAKLQIYMLKKNIIGFSRCVWNISERFLLQVLLPNSLRRWVYEEFAREKIIDNEVGYFND